MKIKTAWSFNFSLKNKTMFASELTFLHTRTLNLLYQYYTYILMILGRKNTPVCPNVINIYTWVST